MGWFTGGVLYALIWWVVLFAVLPLGAEASSEPDPTTGWRGIPKHLGMRRKLALTTVIALITWGAIVAVIESPYLNFRHGVLAIPNDP